MGRAIPALAAILGLLALAGCAEPGSDVDEIAPTVVSVAPTDGAMTASIYAELVVTFSEELDPASIGASTLTLDAGMVAVPGLVTVSGALVTFTPDAPLEYSTLYSATLGTGPTDLAGNPLAAGQSWEFTTGAAGSGPLFVDLGTAGNFVILAKSAISTVPDSVITGDVGISPAALSFMTGFAETLDVGGVFATAPQVTGTLYAANMNVPTPATMTTAVSDMEVAYTDAAGRTDNANIDLYTGNLGGQTLAPGLYTWDRSVTIPGDLTLQGNGNPNDVWILQMTGSLSLAAATDILLTNGAKAENVFWQVAGQVTTGATSHFEGIILCMTSITLGTNATMNGRALAQTAVHLDQSTLAEPIIP